MIELLVVCAIIALLAGPLLPALHVAKAKSATARCVNNLRQLYLGWTLYANDYRSRLAPNQGGWLNGESARSATWAAGYLTLMPDNPDNTNETLLTRRQFGSIGPYVGSAKVYKCPSDKSTCLISGQIHPRVRSYSMNDYIGDSPIMKGGPDFPFREFRKMGDFASASSRVWLFIDEHAGTINDGIFYLPLRLFGRPFPLQDIPGSRHNAAAPIAFADGHVETKRWTTKAFLVPFNGREIYMRQVPWNSDTEWLMSRMSIPKETWIPGQHDPPGHLGNKNIASRPITLQGNGFGFETAFVRWRIAPADNPRETTSRKFRHPPALTGGNSAPAMSRSWSSPSPSPAFGRSGAISLPPAPSAASVTARFQ